MMPLTKEWVGKAEGDFATAGREFRARRSPNYDSTCFHCQQCALNYLRARLQEASIPFKFRHNLQTLVKIGRPVDRSWSELLPATGALKQFTQRVLYPGASATKDQAKDAVARCRAIRSFVRQSLGLKA